MTTTADCICTVLHKLGRVLDTEENPDREQFQRFERAVAGWMEFSSIELMKKLLPILQDACEAATPQTAFPGTTEWFRARRAEQKCINVRQLELRIERAEREFAVRMCEGKINAAQR